MTLTFLVFLEGKMTHPKNSVKMPTYQKGRLRSTTRSSFMIHDTNFLTGRVRNPGPNSQLIRDPPHFRNPQIRSYFRLTTQSVRFFKAKSVDPRTS